jgi:hypothetical protein
MITTARAALLVVYLVVGAVFGLAGQWIFVVPMALGFFFLVPAVRRDLAAEAAQADAELERLRTANRPEGEVDNTIWRLPGGRDVVAVPLTGPVPGDPERHGDAWPSRAPVETQMVRLAGISLEREAERQRELDRRRAEAEAEAEAAAAAEAVSAPARPSALRLVVLEGQRVDDTAAAA